MCSRLTRQLITLLTCAALTVGCASRIVANTDQRLATLLPADVILLGEQHDAPDHQRVQRDVVQALAARGQLAALVLEMAEQGHSTRGLQADASETQVRAALQWNDDAWPWRAYGPAVMTAVRAGVPVLGANLPRTQLRARMADPQLDTLLPGPALKAQQQAIRLGHCGMLPESQITPMTRVQIARDLTMANTLRAAVQPGQTVLLLAGHGHVDRQLGVPKHLPSSLQVKAVVLGDDTREAEALPPTDRFDHLWPARPADAKDYCAEFSTGRPQ